MNLDALDQRITEQLVRDEGLRLKVYLDSKGIPTIGVGRNLRDRGILRDEAMAMLSRDVAETMSELINALPWAEGLDDARFGVLLNMAFNMGVDGLLKFKQTLALVQAGNWDAAAKEMLNSKWHSDVGERADRLAAQMRTGVWQ